MRRAGRHEKKTDAGLNAACGGCEPVVKMVLTVVTLLTLLTMCVRVRIAGPGARRRRAAGEFPETCERGYSRASAARKPRRVLRRGAGLH